MTVIQKAIRELRTRGMRFTTIASQLPSSTSLLRLLGLALAAALLAASIFAGVSDERQRRALIDAAASRLADAPAGSKADLAHRVRYAPDLDRARLVVSRQAVEQEIDALKRGLPASIPRLRWAAELAESTWRARPESFEAASTLALARWLELREARDPRLYTERDIWEAPLREALRLAPAESEPRTILLRARLALWFSLSSEERAETTALARQAFQEPEIFDALFPGWFAIHDPWTEAAARVVPETGRSARALRYALSGRGDSPGLAHLDRAIEGRAAQRLREALTADDATRIDALAWAPPDARWSADAARAIEALGGGALGTAIGRDSLETNAIRAWWEWALSELEAGRPALGRPALDRLGYALETPACERAFVALATGDLAGAELLEPAASTMAPCWGRALVRKARVLDAAGRREAAAASRELARRVDPRLHSALER